MDVLTTGISNALSGATTEGNIGERRLWRAVLVKAFEDWLSGTQRAQREARTFLFEDTDDFNLVCINAGLDPGRLRAMF